MMSNIKFYCAYLVMIIIIAFLGVECRSLVQHNPALFHLLFIQCINPFFAALMIGIGLAIPCFLLASVLGWLQFFLLITGHINPHLGREGLLKVLDTVFREI